MESMGFMEEETSGERKLVEQDEASGGARQSCIIWSQFPPDPLGHNGVRIAHKTIFLRQERYICYPRGCT
jgi:hypothetical protein